MNNKEKNPSEQAGEANRGLSREVKQEKQSRVEEENLGVTWGVGPENRGLTRVEQENRELARRVKQEKASKVEEGNRELARRVKQEKQSRVEEESLGVTWGVGLENRGLTRVEQGNRELAWDEEQEMPFWSSKDSGRRAGGERRAAAGFWERIGLAPDAVQARVLESGARRGILNCTRQWGKSTMAAAMGVKEAYMKPGSLTLVVSPSARQSGEFVRKAAEFARRLKVKPKGDGDNEISLAFPNGSRMVGLPGSEATVRGFSAVSLLLVDEAARVSDELYLAMRPMLAVSDGRLWLMSTPCGKRGFFWETWERGGAEWLRVRVPATECARISAHYLEEEMRVLGERWFRQEYLCEFEDAAGGVFNRDLIERAVTKDVKPLQIP